MLDRSFPAKDCECSYIDETKTNLQKRLMEHKAAVRRGDRNNGIAVYAQDHDHRVDWEAARVLEQEPWCWKRQMLEAIRNSHLTGFTFHEANQCEYNEERPSLNFQRADNYMHDDYRPETGRYCVEILVYDLLLFLGAFSDDTQLLLTYTH